MRASQRLSSASSPPPHVRPSLPFRALRITALTIPIAALSLYVLEQNGGSFSLSDLYASARNPALPVALTLRAANAKLRREQLTQYFPLATNTSDTSQAHLGRVDTARLPSNCPTEDTFATTNTILPIISTLLPASLSARTATAKWTLFGIFDGHAGWATSAYLRTHLLPACSTALGSVTDGHGQALRDVFLAVDGRIMQRALDAMRDSRGKAADARAISGLAPAVSGSCALVAAWNPEAGRLVVGCTGDSRAVLGRRQNEVANTSGEDGGTLRYSAKALSVDQSGSNEDEVARLNAAHPNEPEMLRGLREKGRLFGLMVTRAFGDHRLKLETKVLEEMEQEQFGSAPRPHANTQPYLTAEPEVTDTAVQRGEIVHETRADGQRTSSARPGDFVVLASDGLWDHMSSDDAVYCVQRWLEAKQRTAGKSLRDERKRVEAAHAEEGEPASSEKLFHIKDGYAEWKYKREWLVAEDDNAATHLVRNALGGRNRGFFCGLLSTYTPMSRYARDDMTVQVVFFGGVE